MSNLKSLTFTVAPKAITTDPRLIRRQRLIEKLEEQRKLAADANYRVTRRRWIKDTSGEKALVEVQRPVRAWWREDTSGNLVLILRYGVKTIEIEKDKPAIVVGAKSKLDGILVTLIAAAKAGELDEGMERAGGK
jgi:hypothetical protein